MKGWIKVAVVLVAIILIASVAYYVIGSLKTAPQLPVKGDDPNVVRVNATAVSIYLGALDPEPMLSSITFRLYAPGMHQINATLSLSPQAGLLTSGLLYDNVTMEYHDLNNDSAAGNGDFLTVRSSGALTTGIWHVEIVSAVPSSGITAFHFHVLPPGISSISENMEVDFIDVGQGDAELIHTSDGKHVLIDAGPNGAEASLLSYLDGKGVTVLDALIISHPDADHIGGAEEVLEALQVKSVYHPGLVKNTSTFWSFIAAAEQEGCPILTSADVRVGDYLDLSLSEDFRVLSINASTEANDASIVLKMDAPSRSFLFTGDIGFETENKIMLHFPHDLNADILKVSHHGSRTSSSELFLEAVTPSVAVIEVGVNTYGHPTADTLSRLSAAGATVVRTDQAGSYVVTSSGGSVQ
ncbi:MAG: ComEC/Rec2 family competence protein [Candidatus Saccharibacteria bacterium]